MGGMEGEGESARQIISADPIRIASIMKKEAMAQSKRC
jgi:hypothetical protein